jgi:phosphoglycerate dehydrogenase-like enzyme
MKIALLDDYLGSALSSADFTPLAGRAEISVIGRPLPQLEDAIATLAPFDILCTLRERTPFPRALIEALPNLRYLCVTGKRYDTVDLDACRDRGVIVSNTPVSGAGAGAVTELTWGIILSLARKISAEDRLMRAGGWQHFLGNTLRGKRLGIVGLGGLGTDVARIGQAFGMEVIAWSPHLTDERARAAGVTRVDKQALFSSADVVTLHLALAETTRGIVGAPEIGAMKPTALLVNTARAGLLDEVALLHALQHGHIAGAGLDVYSVEPLPEFHALRQLSNVVLTPHLGYFTQEMLSAYYSYAVENMSSFLDGAPIRVVSGNG